MQLETTLSSCTSCAEPFLGHRRALASSASWAYNPDRMAYSSLKFDDERRGAYLLALERSGEVTAASAAVGLSRQTIYATMKADPEFKEACEAAKGRLVEKALAVAKMLAIDGVVDKTYDKDGNLTGERVRYSERLLLRLIERHLPEWGAKLNIEKKVEHTGSVDISHMTTADKATMRDLLLRNRLTEPSEN